MENGKITIVPQEAEFVRKIFSEYLAGKSLQRLSNLAQENELPYWGNDSQWNKSRIARILDDHRYWEQDGFPPIITKEIAMRVIQQRKEQSTPKSLLYFLKGKAACPSCGAALHRNSRSLPRIFWNCSGCGASFGPFTDTGLYHTILIKFYALCRAPELAEWEQIPDISPSLRAVKLSNEIEHSLHEREVDAGRVLSLILECAAEKYHVCRMSKADPITNQIKNLLKGADLKPFDPVLFYQIIEKIIVQSDGSIMFQLMNHKRI